MKRAITMSDSDQRFTSFYIDEGAISPYENFVLASKWYKSGKLTSQSKDLMDRIIKDQKIELP